MRNRLPDAPATPEDDESFSAPEVVRPRGLETDPPEPLALLPGDIIQLTILGGYRTGAACEFPLGFRG